MKVPGYSRRYIDFHRLSADALENGIMLFKIWRSTGTQTITRNDL